MSYCSHQHLRPLWYDVIRQSSVVERLPSWQTSLCMDDDGEWIKTAKTAPVVPDDAALPSPDDLAYVVMR